MSDEQLSGLRKLTQEEFSDEAAWMRYWSGMKRIGRSSEVLRQINVDAAQLKKKALVELAGALGEFPALAVGLEGKVVTVPGIVTGWIWSMGDQGAHEGYVVLQKDRLVECKVATCYPRGFNEYFPDWAEPKEADEVYLNHADCAVYAIEQQLLPPHLRDEE